MYPADGFQDAYISCTLNLSRVFFHLFLIYCMLIIEQVKELLSSKMQDLTTAIHEIDEISNSFAMG